MRMRKQKKVKRKFPIFLSEFSRAERWRVIFLEWVKWRTLRLLLRHKQSSCDETFYLHFTLILGSFKCHCIACRLVSVFSFCAGRWWNRERNEWIPAAEKKGRISYRFSTYLTFVSSPEGLGTDLDIKLKCTMSIKCSIGIHPIVFSLILPMLPLLLFCIHSMTQCSTVLLIDKCFLQRVRRETCAAAAAMSCRVCMMWNKLFREKQRRMDACQIDVKWDETRSWDEEWIGIFYVWK